MEKSVFLPSPEHSQLQGQSATHEEQIQAHPNFYKKIIIQSEDNSSSSLFVSKVNFKQKHNSIGITEQYNCFLFNTKQISPSFKKNNDLYKKKIKSMIQEIESNQKYSVNDIIFYVKMGLPLRSHKISLSQYQKFKLILFIYAK